MLPTSEEISTAPTTRDGATSAAMIGRRERNIDVRKGVCGEVKECGSPVKRSVWGVKECGSPVQREIEGEEVANGTRWTLNQREELLGRSWMLGHCDSELSSRVN